MIKIKNINKIVNYLKIKAIGCPIIDRFIFHKVKATHQQH